MDWPFLLVEAPKAHMIEVFEGVSPLSASGRYAVLDFSPKASLGPLLKKCCALLKPLQIHPRSCLRRGGVMFTKPAKTAGFDEASSLAHFGETKRQQNRGFIARPAGPTRALVVAARDRLLVHCFDAHSKRSPARFVLLFPPVKGDLSFMRMGLHPRRRRRIT
jgi:hypothetical protein